MEFLNIEAEMVRHKLKKSDLSKELGVSERTINNWLKSNTEMPASAIRYLSNKFNCSADYLLGISSSKMPTTLQTTNT